MTHLEFLHGCSSTVFGRLGPGWRIALLGMMLAPVAAAGPADRVLRPVDAGRTTPIQGNVPRLAQAQFDRGAVDDGMRMEYMVLLMKPSAAAAGGPRPTAVRAAEPLLGSSSISG